MGEMGRIPMVFYGWIDTLMVRIDTVIGISTRW